MNSMKNVSKNSICSMFSLSVVSARTDMQNLFFENSVHHRAKVITTAVFVASA